MLDSIGIKDYMGQHLGFEKILGGKWGLTFDIDSLGNPIIYQKKTSEIPDPIALNKLLSDTILALRRNHQKGNPVKNPLSTKSTKGVAYKISSDFFPEILKISNGKSEVLVEQSYWQNSFIVVLLLDLFSFYQLFVSYSLIFLKSHILMLKEFHFPSLILLATHYLNAKATKSTAKTQWARII